MMFDKVKRRRETRAFRRLVEAAIVQIDASLTVDGKRDLPRIAELGWDDLGLFGVAGDVLEEADRNLGYELTDEQGDRLGDVSHDVTVDWYLPALRLEWLAAHGWPLEPPTDQIVLCEDCHQPRIYIYDLVPEGGYGRDCWVHIAVPNCFLADMQEGRLNRAKLPWAPAAIYKPVTIHAPRAKTANP